MKKLIVALLAAVFLLASCGNSSSETGGDDIINPSADFVYFYGKTCPYCQKLNARIQEEDLFSKISVEKREVYSNAENSAIFQALAEKIGLSPSEIGVPFVYDKVTGKYGTGIDGAYEIFLLWVGRESSDNESSEDTPENTAEDEESTEESTESEEDTQEETETLSGTSITE